MNDPKTSEPVRTSAPSKVKGPVRCHKCQLKCRDAEHYLNHKCEPASYDRSAYSLASFRQDT